MIWGFINELFSTKKYSTPASSWISNLHILEVIFSYLCDLIFSLMCSIRTQSQGVFHITHTCNTDQSSDSSGLEGRQANEKACSPVPAWLGPRGLVVLQRPSTWEKQCESKKSLSSRSGYGCPPASMSIYYHYLLYSTDVPRDSQELSEPPNAALLSFFPLLLSSG